MREDAGGSPISYAAAMTTSASKPYAPTPKQQGSSHTGLQSLGQTGLQGLGKIPGAKFDAKQPKGKKESGVGEVKILKRNQEAVNAPSVTNQDVKKDDQSARNRKSHLKKDDKTEMAKPKCDTKEEDSQLKHVGSPSAQLPRLSKSKGKVEEGDEVDELSSIWQKLLLAQDSPVRSEDEGDKREDEEEKGRREDESGKRIIGEEDDEDEEYVTSTGSQDDEDDDEERMTPNTYRKVKTNLYILPRGNF